MRSKDIMRSRLMVAVVAAAGIACLPGCGSSSTSPATADANYDAMPDSGTPDMGEVTSHCTGLATAALIDDMSGASISFVPPPCGTKGAWFTDLLAVGPLSVPAGDKAVLSHCGSLCQSLYSPMPAGFPGLPAAGDGGALDAAAAPDSGAPGLQAMCFAGQTGAEQYTGAGIVLGFGFSGAVPAGGPTWIAGSVSGATTVPAPVLIDASQYSGIQFWLWVSPSTVAEVTSALLVQLIDKNQLYGGGVCDPNVSGGKACGAASAAVSSTPADTSQLAGPLYADDGTELTALAGGWQRVRVPWSSFTSNPWWGGDNEKGVDPKALAAFELYVMQATANAPALSFELCIYQLTFYK